MVKYKEVNDLSFTNVKDFIYTRLNQGFNDVEIVEEFEDYIKELVEVL